MFFQRKQTSGVEWIICCLGNPGREYENTRHNVGFVTADVLSARTGIPVKRIRFKALTGAGEIAGHKVLIMKPNTYMNLSGTALQEAAAFYKVPAERCLVVSDDVTLDPGRLRLRRNGKAPSGLRPGGLGAGQVHSRRPKAYCPGGGEGLRRH